MAVLALVFAVLALAASARAAITVGGASSANNLFSKGYVPAYDAQVAGAVNPYVSTNSETGITSFFSGAYDIGLSDVPPASVQAAALRHLTVPQSVASFSIFVGAKKAFKVTGTTLAKIYLGQITDWSKVQAAKKKGLSGTIIPVGRSDASGTYDVFTQFLELAAPSVWPRDLVGEGPFSYGNPNAQYVAGSSGILAALAANKNAIGVVQTGLGTALGYKQILLRNKAGKYVTATGKTDYTTSLPVSIPPPTSIAWSGINTIYEVGEYTYPLVSFLYSFYRTKYSSKAAASAIKHFGEYLQSDAAQTLSNTYAFYKVPTAFLTPSIKAIKKIKG